MANDTLHDALDVVAEGVREGRLVVRSLSPDITVYDQYHNAPDGNRTRSALRLLLRFGGPDRGWCWVSRTEHRDSLRAALGAPNGLAPGSGADPAVATVPGAPRIGPSPPPYPGPTRLDLPPSDAFPPTQSDDTDDDLSSDDDDSEGSLVDFIEDDGDGPGALAAAQRRFDEEENECDEREGEEDCSNDNDEGGNSSGRDSYAEEGSLFRFYREATRDAPAAVDAAKEALEMSRPPAASNARDVELPSRRLRHIFNVVRSAVDALDCRVQDDFRESDLSPAVLTVRVRATVEIPEPIGTVSLHVRSQPKRSYRRPDGEWSTVWSVAFEPRHDDAVFAGIREKGRYDEDQTQIRSDAGLRAALRGLVSTVHSQTTRQWPRLETSDWPPPIAAQKVTKERPRGSRAKTTVESEKESDPSDESDESDEPDDPVPSPPKRARRFVCTDDDD